MIKKGKISKKITFIFFLFFLIWIIIQFISPLIMPNNTINHLSGQTGLQNNKDVIDEMPFPINFVYSFGDYFCHQKSDRSLSINENQMPFCTRCTAIWLGIAFGLGFMVFYVISLSNKFLFVIIIGILPLGIDGIGQLFGFWESTNIIRFLTGLTTGVICALAIGVIIDEVIQIKK
jgi:uncharacterized membrane protein